MMTTGLRGEGGVQHNREDVVSRSGAYRATSVASGALVSSSAVPGLFFSPPRAPPFLFLFSPRGLISRANLRRRRRSRELALRGRYFLPLVPLPVDNDTYTPRI